MDRPGQASVRAWGGVLIAFAIAFNLPYAWLAANFDYPAVLRRPPGGILEAFAQGGPRLILAWAAFTLAALLFAPVAAGVAAVTQQPGTRRPPPSPPSASPPGSPRRSACRGWVYAVPGLAAGWAASNDPAARAPIETAFTTLHQFAGVGIGEAIGQSLTGFWHIAVAAGQWRHPRFGAAVATAGMTGGAILLLGLVEGLATVVPFDPGPFGFAALVGFSPPHGLDDLDWPPLHPAAGQGRLPDRPADPRPERTLSLRSRRDHPPR